MPSLLARNRQASRRARHGLPSPEREPRNAAGISAPDHALLNVRTLFAVANLKTIWSGTLYEKSDLPYAGDLSDLPDGFTPFRNKVESKCMIRAPVRAPEAGSIPLPTDFQPPSGLGFGLMPSAASLGLDDESALTAPADPR